MTGNHLRKERDRGEQWVTVTSKNIKNKLASNVQGGQHRDCRQRREVTKSLVESLVEHRERTFRGGRRGQIIKQRY